MQQAITWSNVDQELCCHMVSLGHNELINGKLYSMSAGSFLTHWGRVTHIIMRQEARPSLAEIMACYLIGVKPLSEPMLYYCQLNPTEHI